MLTPSEYDRLCDQLTILYAALDESIIEDITRRMLKTGRVTDAARWQAQQLQQAGMLYEDVLSEIAKRTDATQAHVRTLFEDAGVQAIRNDNRYYKAAGLEGIVKMSDAALQTLHAGFVKCAGNLQNLTLTTANTAQQAYIQASDLAYMQVTTGSMDYNTAIRHAVRSAADEGSFVLYPSGHRDRLDVAVRRAVLTGVGQTVRQLSLINAEDMGCDLMEITAHGGARPSHAEWQGKIVSRSGRRGYLTLQDIGYGRGDGFGGWNCRHDWHPFFEGISQRAYTDARLKELNEPHTEIDGQKYTDYEISQMQRALERNIRKQKRQVAAANAMAEAAPDEALRQAAQADFTRESVKLKAAEKELKDFCKQTGFLPDTSRVWVNGFGRSVSQKAVHANKKAQRAIINHSRALELFNAYDIPDTARITPQAVIDDLTTTEIGRDVLKYLEEQEVRPRLTFSAKSGGIRGEEQGGEIIIYLSNCKDVKTAVCTIIHECTHRKHGIGQSQWAECVCVAQEIMHRRGRNYLTESERRAIIKAVKDAYPEYNWRKGGIIRGRRSQSGR